MIITHINTFTCIVIQLPLTVKLPSMQFVCYLKLYPSNLTQTSENELLRVFPGHIMISPSALRSKRFL